MATEKLEKKYYKIREVAEMLGLPASTIRFWESKFTIINPKRKAHVSTHHPTLRNYAWCSTSLKKKG